MIHSVSLSRSRSPSFLPPLAFLSFSLSISSARKRGGTVKYRRDGVTDQEGPYQPTNPFLLPSSSLPMYRCIKSKRLQNEKRRTEPKLKEKKKEGFSFYYVSLFSFLSGNVCVAIKERLTIPHTHTRSRVHSPLLRRERERNTAPGGGSHFEERRKKKKK